MGHICYLGKPQAADGAYYAGLGGIRMAGKKEALEAYVDACALVRETERDMQRLCRQGAGDGRAGHARYKLPDESRETLQQRREKAEQARVDAERMINGATARMQRIIRYRVFEGLSWDGVAIKMGRGQQQRA